MSTAGVRTAGVAAIVPARNEAARIGATVRALAEVRALDEIIVVDDASDDDTSNVARASGALAFRVHARTGKGGALSFGLRQTAARTLVFIDADLAETARVAGPLLIPVLEGVVDMTIACPTDGAPSGLGLVEGFARWGIRRFTGKTMMRPLSGQRALTRAILDRVGLAPRFGVEVGLTIDAARGGFRISEMPCEFSHARTGRNLAGFSHRARQGLDVARALGVRVFRG